MIILSAFIFYHIIHYIIYDAEIRFTFCFRFQYVKELAGIRVAMASQHTVPRCGNPRAWTSVPGRFPSFLYILFTETRELQHPKQALIANLAVPLTCVVLNLFRKEVFLVNLEHFFPLFLQKGGVPAAPSGTATLLRLSPNHQFCLRPILAVTDFRNPRLSWLDGRCVQGPGTYSPRHG